MGGKKKSKTDRKDRVLMSLGIKFICTHYHRMTDLVPYQAGFQLRKCICYGNEAVRVEGYSITAQYSFMYTIMQFMKNGNDSDTPAKHTN